MKCARITQSTDFYHLRVLQDLKLKKKNNRRTINLSCMLQNVVFFSLFWLIIAWISHRKLYVDLNFNKIQNFPLRVSILLKHSLFCLLTHCRNYSTDKFITLRLPVDFTIIHFFFLIFQKLCSGTVCSLINNSSILEKILQSVGIF